MSPILDPKAISGERVAAAASIPLRSIPAETSHLVSPAEAIVPREPARTTLRFAARAALRSAPSGVRSGTHS